MFVLSNTYTMRRITSKTIKYLLLVVFFIFPFKGKAQSTAISVQPITNTSFYPYFVDVYAYGRYSWKGGDLAKVVTSTNFDSHVSGQRPLNRQYINLGIGCDFYRDLRHHFLVDLGYVNSHLGFNASPFASTGVYTHWLNLDARYLFVFIEGGLKVSTLLGGREISRNPHEVTGIVPGCYNRIAIAPYGGLAYSLQKVKFEARFGYFLNPMLSPNKTAYYNLIKTEISRFYFELGFSFRIFSTRKLYEDNHTTL